MLKQHDVYTHNASHWVALIHVRFTVMLDPSLKLFSAGTVYIRQNLTSVVSQKTVPAMKELKYL